MNGHPIRNGSGPKIGRDIICGARLGRGGGIGRHAVLRGPWALACAGSNPALGTNAVNLAHTHRGDVAKWTKAEVCKTSTRRFESARRLQTIQYRVLGEVGAGQLGAHPGRPQGDTVGPRPLTSTNTQLARLATVGSTTRARPPGPATEDAGENAGPPQVHRSKTLGLSEPRWRNGRRGGLKIRYPNGCVGSNPSLGTTFSIPPR